jgi:YD repeat-containing protein
MIYNIFFAAFLCLILALPSYADTYTYDDLNRLISVTYHETAQVTRYTYDAGGNLLNVITTEPKYDIDVYTKDKEGKALVGVSVTINAQTITSDENGYLPLIDLLAGTYTLIAAKDRHNFTPQEITVGKNSSKTIDIVSDGLTQCQLYAVHDEGRKNTQFITIDANFDINILGPLYEGYDIEAMDAHPKTAQIIVAAGDDSVTPGYLYILNAQTGGLILIGDTGFNEINGLSFKPDGTLWGAAEKNGLIEINPTTAVSALIIPYEGPVEDITWGNEGRILYAIQNQELAAYDSQANYEMLPFDCQMPQGEIEALEMLPDNRLLLGIHNDKTFSIHALKINSCEIESIKLNPSVDIRQPIDIEGIAWPESCSP